LPLELSGNIENLTINNYFDPEYFAMFFVHSFYEEISPQEWNMIEKEARKVKGELNGSFD